MMHEERRHSCFLMLECQGSSVWQQLLQHRTCGSRVCVGQALYSTCQWEMLELLQAEIKGVLNKCLNDRRCYFEAVVQFNLKMSSNAPKVHRASSLSKAIDLGVCVS